MYVLGYSLDTLSLMALTLAVGFVVDDAIVMLENIVRHLEMGTPPMQAAIDGAAEVGLHDLVDDALAHRGLHPAALSRRRRRAAVPRVLGRDRDGDSRVGRRLADVHADARRAGSCARRSASSTTGSTTRSSARATGCSASTRGRSTGRCAIACSRWCSRCSCSSARRCCSRFVPTGFIPDQDIGQINITTEAAQGTSFDDMVRRQQQIAGDRAERHRTCSRTCRPSAAAVRPERTRGG